jgi:hypothetical protein
MKLRDGVYELIIDLKPGKGGPGRGGEGEKLGHSHNRDIKIGWHWESDQP